ncbi:MAG: hypothetical protein QGF46_06885, partial [Planctomycetota bacterium]|nr:hypothetical protein [Planctomycetota bacterium]
MIAITSLILLAAAVEQPQQNESPAIGYDKTYVIHADSAWLEPGRVISPAFVQVSSGRVGWISTSDQRRERTNILGQSQGKGALIKVDGTLAPGIVDAWTSFAPQGYTADRRSSSTRDVSDSLPVQVAMADTQLYSQVIAAREAGVAAVYLSPGWSQVRLGVGSPAEFTKLDLPLVAGKPMLDFALGAASGDQFQATFSATELYDAFVEAQEWRDSFVDYDEKLEGFPEKLEKYQEKLQKYIDEHGPDAPEKEDAEEGAEKPKLPKRPKAPDAPKVDADRDLLLAAIDGKLKVRIQAERLSDLRSVLKLQKEFGLDLVILGGFEADLLADELRLAKIPVVLAATPNHHAQNNSRDFYSRFQRLINGGVEVAIASGGAEGHQLMLLARAGDLIAKGADPDAVWSSLT